MLRRLGFTGRLMAIMLLALMALWALGVGWAYISQSPNRPRLFPPLPKQAAAIVRLLEAVAPNERSSVLEAVDSYGLSVTISPTRPEVAPETRRLVGVEWFVSRYVDALGEDRDVVAFFDSSPKIAARELRLRSYVLYSNRPLKLAVSLKGGGYVVFETRGEIARRLFGLPPGFWMGALGSLIGIAAILAVAREARPLAELARSVSKFGDKATPITVNPRGAPEIAKLINAINEMQTRIAALVKGRTAFFGAVSHDLKTYITRLHLRAEMIPDEDQRARAVQDLDEMTALIDDALAVARSTTVSARREPVDLIDLIRSDVEDWPDDSIVFRASNTRLMLANADAIALRRLFANLIENALRFGQTCHVSASGKAGVAIVLVDDDGPGIPPDERRAVLEPFYRLEPSRSRVTGGSGLGLAIANEIVNAHGGTIAIESAPLGGTRVRIEFPLTARDGSRGDSDVTESRLDRSVRGA